MFRKSSAQKIADMVISYKGENLTLRAISDSGNLLKDPISGKCVIAVASSEFEKLFGAGMADINIDTSANSLKNCTFQKNSLTADRIRIIPMRTAVGSAVKIAVRPDSITIKCEGGREIEVDALIAPADIDGADGYGALVPSELL